MRITKLFLLAILVAAVSFPATAQDTTAPQRIHLDLDANADLAGAWDDTFWHELYPNYCAIWHLKYIDGDGQLKACNNAVFDRGRFHIDWVGPTYFLDCLGIVAEPSGEVNPDGDPTGEVWHEVYPDYCKEWVVEEWKDANGNGIVDECDYVILNGMLCHIKRVSVDIIISPAVLGGGALLP